MEIFDPILSLLTSLDKTKYLFILETNGSYPHVIKRLKKGGRKPFILYSPDGILKDLI